MEENRLESSLLEESESQSSRSDGSSTRVNEESHKTLKRCWSGWKRQTLHVKGKLVLVGDAGTGKTSLLVRYQEKRFVKEYKPTVGVEFSQISVQVEGSIVQFDVWDTAGEERFRSLNSMYYYGCGAGLVVFDVTSAKSFESARTFWIPHLRETGAQDVIIVLCGNKCDSPEARQVEYEAAMKVAREEGILYFETSAKTGYGIRQALCSVAMQVPRVVTQIDCTEQTTGFRITKIESSFSQPSRLERHRLRSPSAFCCCCCLGWW